MRIPYIYDVNTIRGWDTFKKHMTLSMSERWSPARPEAINTYSLKWRFKMAWLVFTGKVDCLRWDE